MIIGLASPTYSGILPEQAPLLWLLDRCAEYDLKALEAPLPLSGTDHPKEVKEKAADLGVTWVGYWSEDFVTPNGGGTRLRERAERAFEQASIGGVKTVVIFGRGSLHNRFTRQPPLTDQLSLAADHLRPVAEAASERDIQLALLPHLDYRGPRDGVGDGKGVPPKPDDGVRYRQSLSGLRRTRSGREGCVAPRGGSGVQRRTDLSRTLERRDNLGNADRARLGRFRDTSADAIRTASRSGKDHCLHQTATAARQRRTRRLDEPEPDLSAVASLTS